MKISIKREQSQAGLSFAERKKFRPQVKNKLLLLLALLLTAATGAWADESSESFTTTSGASSYTGEHFKISVDDVGDVDGFYLEENTYARIEALNGEIITKVEFTQGGWSITDLRSAVGTTTYVGEVATVSGVNATSLTVNADIGLQIKAVKVYYTAGPAGYTVSLKDGVKDADKWTVKVGVGQAQALPIGGLKGDGSETVTLQYTGRLKVKGVKATSDAAAAGNSVDLSTLTADYEAQDGDVLTGTLGGNYKITIADGATVTLSGAVINGTSNNSYTWAGLTLAGDGTIILSGENTVKGFYEVYPGIFVPENKTLTIQGDGSLTASSNGWGAGIGGGLNIACGNITIEGGTVTATGGNRAAGIGGGFNASCGNISITGGTINANGGAGAAGIGGGSSASCGNITIANTVTKVTATKGLGGPNSIGAGGGGTCGTVTIGGNVGAITESPYTYQPSN